MKVCAVDLETSISDTIHGSAAKYPGNDYYTLIYGFHPDSIKVVHKEGGFKRDLGEHTAAILAADLLVGHNMPFDLGYIIKQYVDVKKSIPNTWDCQIAQYILSGQRHAYPSLAEVQDIYLNKVTKESKISNLYKKNVGADKIVAIKERCPRLWNLYNYYCEQDGSTTLKVFKEQYFRAKREGMLEVIQLYNKFMVVLVLIMSQGIELDIPRIEKKINELRLKALDLKSKAIKIIEPYWTDPRLPPFNIGSYAHKSAILFGGEINCDVVKENGYTKNGKLKTKKVKELVEVVGFNLPLSLTKELKTKGRYATDAPVISDIYQQSDNVSAKEYCKLQLKAMNYEKMVSTYLEGFLKYSINGMLYPNFNNTAVITGRLSSSKPNLQNVPAKGEMNVIIQGNFKAPEGYICVSIDYSQLEMWVAAWNSGDDQLIKDLKEGLDFHCQSLAFAEQMSYEEVYNLCQVVRDPIWADKRSKAKAITFQKEYGAGVKTVAKKTGLDVGVVEKVFADLDAKYWKLKMFKDYVFETANSNLVVSNIKYIPTSQRRGGEKGRRFNSQGQELLPIYEGLFKKYSSEIRSVGYFKTKHGKKYAFEEYGGYDREGRFRKSISPPQTKNYTSQGGAADIMAATSIEVMNYCLQHSDDVKFVNQIHDSNWFYIKKDKKDLHLSKIADIMEDIPSALKKHLNVNIDFKFKVESKVGENFAEMEVYN